jgi:thioesterase domain-containing protein/acyl carrier protein
LKRLLVRSEATVLQATPATWRMLVDSGWSGDPRLKVLCGGEALPGGLASELHPRCLELWNMYGPTETTIWSSIFKVQSQFTGTVPIGRPIANTQFYILDRNFKPVPVGVMGELYIGGAGVARGYLQRDELTAQKFLPDPFRLGGLMYRTGDQARFLADGNVQYLGRIDDQVKVRGYRIEPGEIESALMRYPGVKDCVVVLKDEAQCQRLVAYIVTRSPRDLPGAELENHLRKTLPDYMIPGIVHLESLPLTPAGKIDRRALPAPAPLTARAPQALGPRDELEMAVLEIWERLLGIQNCAMTDNFFELGGHSLLLVRLSAMIEKEFDETIPLSFLFESATIEKIAAYLRDNRGDKSGFFLPFNQTGSRPTFYCVHSLVGDAISCRHLARFLDADQGFYGIQIPPRLRLSEFVMSVEAIAQRYIAELIEFNPTGPYVLGGWSAGVPIALEMAQQLQKLGREVPLLVVIDSVPANTGGGSHRLSPRYNGKLIRNIPRWAANDLALNFSWSGLYRRASHKVKAFIEGIPIARRSKEELAQHRAKVFVTAGAYSESTNAFMQTFALTLAKYVPKPYSGQVVLYKARTDPLFKVREIDLKWRKIASRLDVVQVNGTHNTVLDESNVPLLAKDLNARLKECRQRALQDSPEAVTGSQYALRGRSEMPAGLETV